MIVFLRGKIIIKDLNFLIVETGGVGYRVFFSPVKLAALGDVREIELFIHEHIRDDARELYGFLSLAELKLFWKLTSVSGVGPKSGQNILGLGSPEEVENAIEKSDVAFLTRVSGVGKKIAERIILELRGKLVSSAFANEVDEEVVGALMSLGYSRAQANEAMQKVAKEGNAEERIKAALKELGR